MFTLVFGTNNRKKGIELAELLTPYNVEVRTLADFDKKLDAAETFRSIDSTVCVCCSLYCQHTFLIGTKGCFIRKSML